MLSPEEWRQRAQQAAGAGNAGEAARLMEAGAAEHPRSAPIANSAGHFNLQAGNAEGAERWFAQALDLAPGTLEYAVNRAVALTRLGRDAEAVSALEAMEDKGRGDARYCSARGAAERARGNLAAAARWYDSCLAVSPGHARALLGRARVSLERGEADAVRRFEASLAANRTDPEGWYGLAQSFEAAGDAARARQLAEQLAAQAPHWTEIQRFLSGLLLAAGVEDFAAPFAKAAELRPQDPAIPLAHAEALGGLDRDAEAAEMAAGARRRMPDNPELALLEAIHASNAGQMERAGAIFADLALDTPRRWLQEARHSIRVGEYDRAARLLDRSDEAMPWSISVWALRDCLWRVTGDDRSEWLHGQEGLVRKLPLPDARTILSDTVPLLHELHDRSAFPLGQSLRGGTQTRGNLLDRTEPELARLRGALEDAIESYRAGLPPLDEEHPLLRLRESAWRITGSWSVRLDGGGDYHTAHLHPQGILSSALYCDLPEGLDTSPRKDGWLELGRPAPDLALPLEPLYEIAPEPGCLALFPSSLYHGTKPFGTGRRMTVAFDVALGNDARS